MDLLSNLGMGFSVASSFANLGFCLIGVLLGTLIGVLPGIGATATLAGIDKFFNLLADWGSYVSPLATQLLPVSTGTY